MKTFAQNPENALKTLDKNADKSEAKSSTSSGNKVLSSSQRIAIVGRLEQPGGVQSVILSLIKGLNAHGVTPDLIWDTPPASALLSQKGVRAHYQPVHFWAPSHLLDRLPTSARYFFTTANCFSDRQLPKQYDFYFIFFNGFLVDEAMPHLRYLNGPPLLPQLEVIHPGLRGLPYHVQNWLYQRLLRQRLPVYEYHRGSNYVINSGYTAQLFEEAHGVRLPVVHPPIDLSGRSFTPADLSSRDTITFFSRFVDYKRPEMVLQLASCYPHMRFVLMGGVKPQNRGYFESLRQKASSQGWMNVTWFDNPSDAQVKNELARTRFFVFPAVNEHFGMATAEAIASGAIPYVHDSGGQREIVPDPRLRFTDDWFFRQFASLAALPPDALNQIRLRLRDHVSRFSEEVFIQKMLAFIPQLEG